MNKYKVTPSSVKENSVRFNSIKHLPIIPPALDAGGRNEIAEAMGIKHFSHRDLNYDFEWKLPYFQTVTSFEVIEHLQNPLFYLCNLHNALAVGGVLYLTTPVKWIFKGKHHFHEFTYDELRFCLQEAGFKNIHIQRIRAYNYRGIGIRPIIRWLRDVMLGQCWLVIAEKTKVKI